MAVVSIPLFCLLLALDRGIGCRISGGRRALLISELGALVVTMDTSTIDEKTKLLWYPFRISPHFNPRQSALGTFLTDGRATDSQRRIQWRGHYKILLDRHWSVRTGTDIINIRTALAIQGVEHG